MAAPKVIYRPGIGIIENGNTVKAKGGKPKKAKVLTKVGKKHPAEARMAAGTDEQVAAATEAMAKRKPGRPSTGFDRAAYQKQYMADQKLAKAAGMSVAQWRARKGTL